MRKILVILLMTTVFFGLVTFLACSKKDPLEPAAAKTWVRTYDINYFDYFLSVTQGSSGDFVATGMVYYYVIDSSVFPHDSTLQSGMGAMKFNSSGDTVWYRIYGGANSDMGYEIVPAHDGGYVMAGYTSSFGAGGNDVYLVKIDENGEQQWQHTFGGISSDYGYHLKRTNDNGYIIGGRTNSFGMGSYDMYAIKTNQYGLATLPGWALTYGTTGSDGAEWVEPLADGDYLIAGYSDNGTPETKILLVRVDGSGAERWRKWFGIGDYVKCIGVLDLGDDGFFVAGESSTGDEDDLYLARLNTAGNVIWQKTIAIEGVQTATSIVRTADGAVVLCGTTSPVGSDDNLAYLTKIDLNGNVLWERFYGDIPGEYAFTNVTTVSDGGLLAVGITISGTPLRILGYIVKTDANGLVQ